MTTTRADLMARAILKYKFRPPRKREDAAAYLYALVAHVHSRDFTEAHELRIGKAAKDWTADDVRLFKDIIDAMPGPREEFDPNEFHAYPAVREKGDGPATEERLMRLAARGLFAVQTMRRATPTKTLMIFVTGLLDDGDVISTTLTERGDRVALLKTLARKEPLFGFVIVFDAFLHHLDPTKGGGKKTDAIIAQVGTRDRRICKVRTYRVEGDEALFDDPPPEDIDLRGPDVTSSDPYASVFVSVPTPTGRPS